MTTNDIRTKYIEYFKARGHKQIPSAPLVPENDPTTLFTSSGMQPLIPYLLGQPHPSGKRLVNSQKAFRAQDIDEVGDNRHTTFFEMLGNWSLGDYFKKEQLPWIFEFLTKELGLDPNRLYVTVFSGEAGSGSAREGSLGLSKDDESIALWKEIFKTAGIDAKVSAHASSAGSRIFAYDARKNWWSRSGEPEKMPIGEPGGPDSEVFFDFGPQLGMHEKSPFKDQQCHPNCDCGRFMEIANSVFMQYKKESDGSLKELDQKNVDFGGGLERIAAASIDSVDLFKTDLFSSVIGVLEQISKKSYSEAKVQTDMRVIADHIKGAMFLILEGVTPHKEERGYVVRKLIRKSYLARERLGIKSENIKSILECYANVYKEVYPVSQEQISQVTQIITDEEQKASSVFSKKSLATIDLRIVESITKPNDAIKVVTDQYGEKIDIPTYISLGSIAAGTAVASLASTYGVPVDFQKDIVRKYLGADFHLDDFNAGVNATLSAHSEVSRSLNSGMFKGGLADQGEQTTKLHTAHHLFLAAVQKLVDPTIKQRGSNITGERLRIDFNFSRKLTNEELKGIETLVNDKIKENLNVDRVEMPREVAQRMGAQMEFGHKYPEIVSVFIIGLLNGIPPEKAKSADYFSAEFCGGPHVLFTGALGHFTIIKEESAGSGIRRVYATLT